MSQLDLTVSVEIARPVDEVAPVLCDFGRLHDWHPAVERCVVERAEDASVRTFTINDQTYRDRLLNVADDGLGYFYEQITGPVPGTTLKGFVAVEATSETSCRVNWSASVDPGQLPASAVRSALTGLTEAGLAAFKTQIELGERGRGSEDAGEPTST